MQKLLRTAVLAALTLVVSPVVHSRAAEIKCICAEAIRPPLTELGAQFERATGHKLIAAYDLGPVVARKIEQGEPFDLSVLNLRNPVQRGHRFQRKADINPVIADSR